MEPWFNWEFVWSTLLLVEPLSLPVIVVICELKLLEVENFDGLLIQVSWEAFPVNIDSIFFKRSLLDFSISSHRSIFSFKLLFLFTYLQLTALSWRCWLGINMLVANCCQCLSSCTSFSHGGASDCAPSFSCKWGGCLLVSICPYYLLLNCNL